MAGYSFLLILLQYAVMVIFLGRSEQVTDYGKSAILHSFFKTIAMFTDESEFSETSFDILPVVRHVILSLVSLAGMILLNMAFGLVVFDTQKLRSDAETQTVVAKVRILKKINNWQEYIRPYEMKEGKLTVYPNRWKTPYPYLPRESADLPCFSLCIRKKRQPSRTLQSTEQELIAMEKKLKEIQETLSKIVTRLDIGE
jgi:hypothetical protein